MTDLGSIDLEIQGKESPGDLEIGELARRQHRVVAVWQLLALGFGRGAIEHRLREGSLYRLSRGVYAVGCASVVWRGRVMGATLACGPEAVASHGAAGALHGLRPMSGAAVDVTVPRSRHGQPGIRVHRVRSLHPDDRDVVDGIPVTSVARTLLEKLRVFDLRAIERLVARSRGRRGIKPLRAVIAAYAEPPITRSELERRFIALCDQFAIPRPETNVIVAGRVVDGVWHEARLVVEIDSREHHMTTAAFEEDRRRDADLMLAGYRVLRITWRRLRDEPAEVARTVLELLARG
jgi:Protein of unknown function (DUF559)